MRATLLILPLTLLLSGPAFSVEAAIAIDFSECKDNAAIDSFLCQASPLYAAMARIVNLDGAYRFKDKTDVKCGSWNAAERTIKCHPRLQGAERASVIAFEMTNAYQQRLHTIVDTAAASGEITTESEFALRHELIEYDGLRLHRAILAELEEKLGKLPPDFFFRSNPKPDSVAEYRLPLVMDYLTQMKASGHTAYYYQWFEKQQQSAPAQPNKSSQTKWRRGRHSC